ncbi:hypothetical protein [Kitasatospora sp. NPDC015120]|uniref:hypothetical protein n=1 Tax=Kitasatospora sp. NPDC015120 TaxID=3364023 RepID=UPI0036F46783
MSARRRSWAVSVERAAGRPDEESGPRREDAEPEPEQERGPAVADAPAEDEEDDGPEPPAADRAAP